MRFTVVTGGSVFHRCADSDGVAATCATAWLSPAGVSATFRFGEERERIRHRVARDHHRHHVGERRARVSALGERAASAEQQQSAAAHVHEIREHRELVVREEARFDARRG